MRMPRKARKAIRLLRGGQTLTNTEFAERTGIDASEFKRQYPGQLATSLNQNRTIVTHPSVVKRRADDHGFLTLNGTRFHTTGNAKDAILHVVRRSEAGLTRAQADDLLGRDTGRLLAQMVNEGAVRVETLGGRLVYLDPGKWRVQAQKREARDREGQRPGYEDAFLLLEDVFDTLRGLEPGIVFPGLSAADSTAVLCALFGRVFHHDTLRSLELRLKVDERFRTTTGLGKVPDHSTLGRRAKQLTEAQLRALLTKAVRAHTQPLVKGRLLGFDTTHQLARANTRRTVRNGDVEGAAWGHHEGKFYGYKVGIIVDTVEQLPVAITFSPGNVHDRVLYLALLDDLEARYSKEELREATGMLSDGALDEAELREVTLTRLGVPLSTPIAPRRDKGMMAVKREIHRIVESGLATVEGVLARLKQRGLEEFGVVFDGAKESRILGMIRWELSKFERLAVERVWSRLKCLLPFEQASSTVRETVVRDSLMCVLWMHLVALTADRVGLPGNRRSLARVV